MATLNIRIDDDLATELAELARLQHTTRSDLVREMLRRRIAVERFKALRNQAVPYAQAAGYVTDEDILGDAP